MPSIKHGASGTLMDKKRLDYYKKKLLARRDDEIRALQQDIAANEAEHDAVAARLNAEIHDLESLLGAANNTQLHRLHARPPWARLPYDDPGRNHV